MSGGVAYLLEADPERVNPEMVDLEPLDADDESTVRELLARHAKETDSPVATGLLEDWRPERYTRVMPRDYKRVLTAMREAEQSGQDANELIMGALRG
jgi:glutamate synthase (NADPH/NADH) large chain